jgi:hypothetical protein
MKTEKQQSAVEWLQEQYNQCPRWEEQILEEDWEQAKEMEKVEKIKAQIDVLNLLNDTHPLRINIMIRKLKEQLKLITFKSE